MANENDTETAAEPTLREVLEAAYDGNVGQSEPVKLEKVDAPTSDEPDPAAADKAALGGDQPATEVPDTEHKTPVRGPDGKFQAKPKAPEAAPEGDKKGGPPAAAATPRAQPAAVPPPAAAAPAIRAPQSWRPQAREEFGKLPRIVQEEAVRLERERETVLRTSAEARRFSDEFQRVVSPYVPHIQRAGSTPLQAVQNMMQTAAALEGPNRAAVIWQVMQSYGVTPEALADAIDGRHPSAAAGAPPQPAEYRDPRVDQMLYYQRQQWEAYQQQVNTAADAELAEFEAAGHDFVNDVLPEMLDFMDVASKRGVAMDYETAYARAVASRPDLQAIISQRQAAEAAANPEGSTRRAVLASSSVKSTPGGKPKSAKYADTREALEAAWEKHSNEGGRV